MHSHDKLGVVRFEDVPIGEHIQFVAHRGLQPKHTYVKVSDRTVRCVGANADSSAATSWPSRDDLMDIVTDDLYRFIRQGERG
jgi:hypothetical protein